MTERRRKSTKKRSKDNEKIFTFDTVLFLIMIAAIFISIITWQSYRINSADIEISKLETQLKEAQMLNDSLEGKLLAKRDLQKVQKIATTKYGMIKPGNSYFVAVNVDSDKTDTLNETKSANAKSKNSESTFSKLLGSFASN